MIIALLVAAVVGCVVPPSSSRRSRQLLSDSRSRGAGRLSLPWLAGATVLVAGYVVLGGVLGVVVGAVAAPLGYRAVATLESSAQRRRSHVITTQMPIALDLMVSVLDVGHPPSAAFALTAEATPEPLGPLLQGVAHRLTAVGDERAVWAGLAVDPDLSVVGRAFGRALDTGIPVAHILGGTADEARRNRRARRRDAARRIAVSTAAPLGLCFLPAFFVVGVVPTIISTFASLTW